MAGFENGTTQDETQMVSPFTGCQIDPPVTTCVDDLANAIVFDPTTTGDLESKIGYCDESIQITYDTCQVGVNNSKTVSTIYPNKGGYAHNVS